MSTSSFNPASTANPPFPKQRDLGQRDPGHLVLRDRLVDLANRAQNQREFFQHLAAEMQAHFGAGIVIFQSPAWPRPLVHSRDAGQLGRIDIGALDDLLATSTAVPISCDVPRSAASMIENPRALRVELVSVPQRVAALIVYASDCRPSAVSQVDDLKKLQQYAETTRELVRHLPLNVNEKVAFIHRAHSDSPAHSETSGGEFSKRRALSSFHHSLDVSETCFRIANEARRILGCDRVTILVPKHSRFRVTCVSGVAVVDRRSNPMVAIERLVNAAVVLDRQLMIPSDEPLPPQVQVPLDHYLDEAGVSSAIMIPLKPLVSIHGEGDGTGSRGRVNGRIAVNGQIQGVLLLENFSGSGLQPSAAALGAVADEAGISLRNALEHQSVFGLSLWKMVGRLIGASRTPICIAAIGMAIALLAAGLVWPVEHYVVATGTVEPASRRDLFAAVEGSVQRIHVHDGQQVAQGELLIQLENPELENRAEALAGQIQTTTGRLASIQAVRLGGKDEASQSSRLVLEERQLESELANLHAQHQVLKLQLADLAVVSPIDGKVVAWQIERRLMGRPVNRGNLLCSVVNPQGPWRLRLTVPEQNAGPVVDEAKQDRSLSVSFAVATMPERTFQASLDGLSFAARTDELGNRVIDLNASVAGDPPGSLDHDLGATNLRVGADVTAKIACGQRTLIRSWFSDVFDFVNRHILFRFR